MIKRKLYSLIGVFLILSIASATDIDQKQGHLTVIVYGAENDSGVIRIAVSNSQENYEDMTQPFLGASVKPENGIAVQIFENIPFGEYAVKVFHDENDNENLDTSFIGAPTESYGFSNNARAMFGPASWEDARFTFKSVVDTIKIKIK